MGQSYKLRGKDLSKIGYTSDRDRSIALQIIKKHFKFIKKEEVLSILKDVLASPDQYLQHEFLSPLANSLMPELERSKKQWELEEAKPVKIYGGKYIQGNAKMQMQNALSLPISIKGAMMPDAHHGYGLPIGGVLATQNAVIPYGVGMDIACRMSLSVFDIPASILQEKRFELAGMLKDNTRFGKDNFNDQKRDHPFFDQSVFNESKYLKALKDKAYRQIGTSGSGNHFVEWGIVNLNETNPLGLNKGRYLGLLSHSGSRGFGANIAQHFTRIAMKECLLPKGAQHLAWLDMDGEAGQAYWEAMELAGQFAEACHEQIHQRLQNAVGGHVLSNFSNHHNFAWKTTLEDGSDVILHRKGATPAEKGALGIIPGSMATDAYLVEGRGNPGSLYSASHGAGRLMSRQKVKDSFTQKSFRQLLKKAGVQLIGGALDEAPFAYKDIEKVMSAQQDLVNSFGTFSPRIVRMDKS